MRARLLDSARGLPLSGMQRYRRFLERVEMRRAARAADDGPPFPVALFALASAAVCGLLYQLVTALPAEIAEGSIDPTSIAGQIARVGAMLGAIPFLSLGTFAVAIAPGLLRPLAARPYFLGLTLAALGLWAVCFVAGEEPARRLGEALHELATERQLPDPLGK